MQVLEHGLEHLQSVTRTTVGRIFVSRPASTGCRAVRRAWQVSGRLPQPLLDGGQLDG